MQPYTDIQTLCVSIQRGRELTLPVCQSRFTPPATREAEENLPLNFTHSAAAVNCQVFVGFCFYWRPLQSFVPGTTRPSVCATTVTVNPERERET